MGTLAPFSGSLWILEILHKLTPVDSWTWSYQLLWVSLVGPHGSLLQPMLPS